MSLTQDQFNTVLFGIRAQGGPAARGRNRSYRTTVNGQPRKCAAGWLLPDEQYNKRYERFVVDKIPFFAALGEDTLIQLRRLQCIHDDADPDNFFKEWEPRMERFAKEYAHTYTPPST